MIERILAIIVPVFGVIAVGYGYARWRGERVRSEAAALNTLNLGILGPLLCFTALAAKDFAIAQHARLLVGAAIVIAVSGLAAWPIARLAGFDARTFVPPMMFNNCGNMGLPLAVLAFGPAALGPAVALLVLSNTLHFSLGIRIVAHGQVPWSRSLRLLANPMMVGTAIGLAFALVRPPFPQPLFDALKLLGDAAIPLMLFALGIRMVDVTARDWRIGAVGALVCPVAGLAGAFVADALLGLDAAGRGQLFLFAALPPAVLNFMLAEVYGQEPEKVASITLIGNLAAVVFVPAGLALGLVA